jgi:hypothetical protein
MIGFDSKSRIRSGEPIGVTETGSPALNFADSRRGNDDVG